MEFPRVSGQRRAMALLVAAGHLEPHSNGRHKPSPGVGSGSAPQATT
jgi:hypothetical protein